MEWKPNWWARLFRGARPWTLSIGDGRVRIQGIAASIDVDVSEVASLAVRERPRALLVSLTHDREAVLAGVSRRSAYEIQAAHGSEVAERHRLHSLFAAAAEQGESARLWWNDVQELMSRPRWADRDAVAALHRTRPTTDGWIAASTELQLSVSMRNRSADERAAVEACRTLDLAQWSERRNEEFLAWEKQELADFFRTVEKSPLTEEQIRATVCFDNRVRVIAAAGSGKTSTMVARAGYAITRGVAQPVEILALAFNKKAAGELSERMEARLKDDRAGVASSTFHAFGLRIIGEATGRKPSLPDDLVNDNGMGRLAGVVDVLRDRDPVFRRNWDLFRLVFGRQLPDLGDEADPEKADPRTKALGFGTLAGEVVNSQEEVMIANWLFLNGVNYEYERPYAHDVADAHHRQYQPDFYYPDIDVWHEHWAIGPDGTPPPQFTGYAESMQWRRQTHAAYGTVLIETTSATIRDGSGFEHLEQELRRHGIELDENPYREAAGEPPINDKAMLTLMRAFMSHAKGNRLIPEVLGQRAGRSLRNRLFVQLYEPVLTEWDRQLHAARQIDFEDMLNLATDHVEAGRWTSPYRLVMVDEMQDTSTARAALVRALTKTPGTYLYAVGDDWQAINRFAGSDLSVMTRFDDWFGASSTIWLDWTFRSPQSLCDVAGSFVTKNPGQIVKHVRSSADDLGVTVDALSVSDGRDYARVLREHLVHLDGQIHEPASVLVLGRYRSSADDVANALRSKYSQLRVEFNTVHGSKGKEADYVVILGLERGAFPDMREDDPVLQLAMAAPDPYPNAEERRLFYVALTRARRSVLLLTRRGRESPFLIELVRDGAVKIRSPKGDDVTPCICPKCRKRAMVERSGRYGAFMACTGYPLCDGTMQIGDASASPRVRAQHRTAPSPRG
ncbi:DNA helicase-4 [Microbacterium natoriense]|uniref:DNA 3'-5' helicase n=1 Tax=Microbacterium natoriense TaxID=284570 RepID=A0AAW8F0I1_9MICO|nr:UvrD-helicase domain-containing protein [Microbacterium natoriense]MDQ0648639.1 DNA helicase-4 [Microbacterium natoriense]